MARHWRRYMKTWVKVDEAMKHYGSSYKSEKRAKILIFILTMASEDQWMEVREDYNRLECHCKIVNSELGYAYLISFAGNLGGVLIQLYNTLNFKATVIGLTYLYYSFGFVLTRILCVCFFGSNVNEQAKRSLMFLYRAPNSAYYTEIAGSIVTYELVLVQFAGEVIKDDSTLKNKTNSL
ncbi:unnamed protein product [Acanthoscelides obtectus]|uniref:Uncharacterized protein n=1 Tax=Acanthoscelides obtectus TaxID=200917 RepID=A0A9P0K3C5_ACAOB|nr:unnamed protein product [Acanthoscelides obtectus]CAK1629667.1 Gustatory receptor for sugar taste 64f [Acanthoscelides obtectus]